MDASWINVVDTAVKIGLGSLLTAISGYFALKLNHEHENKNKLESLFYNRQDERKIKYVDYMTIAQNLVQTYLNTSCNCSTDDYKDFLRAYTDVQILAPDDVKMGAYKVHCAVNEFIVLNKNNYSNDERRKLRSNVNDSIGLLQELARVDVTKPYKKT